MADISHSYQS